jgi:hypothetical protein
VETKWAKRPVNDNEEKQKAFSMLKHSVEKVFCLAEAFNCFNSTICLTLLNLFLQGYIYFLKRMAKTALVLANQNAPVV